MDERLDYEVGDTVKLKEPYPCGSSQWEALGVEADFRLRCMRCGHQTMIACRLVKKNTRGLTETKEDSWAVAPGDIVRSVMKIMRKQRDILHLSEEFVKIMIRNVLYPCSCH